jgi:hypothetical protein
MRGRGPARLLRPFCTALPRRDGSGLGSRVLALYTWSGPAVWCLTESVGSQT